MNQATRLTTLLDLGNPAEIAAYERSFYRGFEHATHNRLVRWLWHWDIPERRLRTRIPYSDQRIWVVKDPQGEITDAVAVNVTLQSFQSSAYGFTVPADLAAAAAVGRVCEFLTFFAVGHHALSGKRALWRELFVDLRTQGFTDALGTCSPKVLPIYRWMGAALIGTAEIEGEGRNFLRFALTKTERS